MNSHVLSKLAIFAATFVINGLQRFRGALCVCALHKFLGASTHLVGRNILDVRCDGPCVSERILQRGRSRASLRSNVRDRGLTIDSGIRDP
jgi:hypothetical protein